MESDTWDFFDLDQEIHVAISEDGKEYLKQFGLEEYNFENFESVDGPGKYYDDVPLDENPEAILDILSRETHQRQSSRREGTKAPPRPSPRKTKDKPRRDPERRSDHGNDVTERITERHNAADDIHLQRSPAKTPPKKVSFNDRPARDDEAAVEVPTSSGKPAKVSRSAASFFGRPKTKTPEKKAKSKMPEGKDSRNGACASIDGIPAGDTDTITDSRDVPGSNSERTLTDEVGLPTKNRGPSSPKKTRKFKFPGLELVLRAKGKVGTSAAPDESPTNVSTIENPTKNDQPPVRNHTRFPTQDDVSFRSPNTNSNISNKDFRTSLGVEKLDLVKHSPELGAMKASAHQPMFSNVLQEEYEPENIARIAQSDERTSVMSHKVHTLKPSTRHESDMRIVEIVSTDPTEMTPDGAAMVDDMILGMEANLPPPLLAAVTGDVQLMRKAISDLSREELLSSRDGRGNTVLHVSAAGGYLPCVELLCTFCPQLLHAENKTHLTPTPMAIKHGQIEILDWMLENIDLRKELRPPSSSKRRSLLHHAARFGQSKPIRQEAEALCQEIVHPATQEAEALCQEIVHNERMKSIRQLEDGCVRLLLSKMERTGCLTSSCVDQYGNSPAHMAAKYGHLTCIQSLVEYGLDVCCPNQQGHTPCYYADFGNHRHCAGYLVVVETCAQLTKEHVTQTMTHDRLQAAMGVSKNFTKEALDLCSIISRQSTEQVDAKCRLQQTMDESLDVITDMAGLLKDLYRQNCELRDIPSQTSSPTCDDVHLSLERAADIQRRLEALENIINPHASRQHMVRVKDLQRRWAAASQVKEVPAVDPIAIAKQSMKQRLSGSIQRLLVYRTTMRSSQLLNSQTTTSTEEDDSLSAFKPKPRHDKPKPIPLYIKQPTSNNMFEIKNSQTPLSPLSPRARTNNTLSAKNNNGSKQKTNWFEDEEDSTSSVQSDHDSSHHSLPGFCPTKGAFSRPDKSPEKVSALPKKIVKNNVVESFLNSRLFYQEDAEKKNKDSVMAEPSAGPGSRSKLWFYERDALPDVDVSMEMNKGLRTSAFSAFNRVSTNRTEEDARPTQISYSETKQSSSNLPKSLETCQNNSDAKGSHAKTENKVSDVLRVDKENNYQGPPTGNKMKEKDIKTLESRESHCINTATKAEQVGADGTTLDSSETRLNISLFESNTTKQGSTNNSSNHSTHSTTESVLNKIKDVGTPVKPGFVPGESDLPAATDITSSPETDFTPASGPAQSEGEDCDVTVSEASVSDAELDGDDLMLGSYDDPEGEHDGRELNDVFSAEDLLTLAANGRLPLSMQFETSLSTIEEVSVVSESTRGDDEASDDPILDSSVDLEQTTDSDDTMTGPSDHASSLVGDLDPREADEAKGHSADDMERQQQAEDDEKPWYEMSDDEEVITRASTNAATRGRKEHFTLF